MMACKCGILPEVAETTTTKVLTTAKLFDVTHKEVEVSNERIVFIPVEEVD